MLRMLGSTPPAHQDGRTAVPPASTPDWVADMHLLSLLTQLLVQPVGCHPQQERKVRESFSPEHRCTTQSWWQEHEAY